MLWISIFQSISTYLLQEIGRCQEMTLCEGFVSSSSSSSSYYY